MLSSKVITEYLQNFPLTNCFSSFPGSIFSSKARNHVPLRVGALKHNNLLFYKCLRHAYRTPWAVTFSSTNLNAAVIFNTVRVWASIVFFGTYLFLWLQLYFRFEYCFNYSSLLFSCFIIFLLNIYRFPRTPPEAKIIFNIKEIVLNLAVLMSVQETIAQWFLSYRMLIGIW